MQIVFLLKMDIINEDKKLDRVPTWDKQGSYDGWRKEVMVWASAKGKMSRKALMMVEYMKKDEERGLKDLAHNQIIENKDFNYNDPDALTKILDIIKEHVRDNNWSKTIQLCKDLKEFRQNIDEKNKDYVQRFTKLIFVF